MTEQPAAVVETPKHRFAVRLPSRTTVKNTLLLGGVFGLGAYAGHRKTKDNCACESDVDTTAGQSTD